MIYNNYKVSQILSNFKREKQQYLLVASKSFRKYRLLKRKTTQHVIYGD